jgi:hypothetical protein
MANHRCTPLNRLEKIRGRKRIIDNQRDARLLGNLGQFLQRRDLQSRVANTLAKDRPRLVVNRRLDDLGITNVDKLCRDAKFW